MSLTADDILRTRFRFAWRGYATAEVDDFLDRVASALAGAPDLGADPEEVCAVSVLALAERTARSVVREAEQEAADRRADLRREIAELEDRSRQLRDVVDDLERRRSAGREQVRATLEGLLRAVDEPPDAEPSSTVTSIASRGVR